MRNWPTEFTDSRVPEGHMNSLKRKLKKEELRDAVTGTLLLLKCENKVSATHTLTRSYRCTERASWRFVTPGRQRSITRTLCVWANVQTGRQNCAEQ